MRRRQQASIKYLPSRVITKVKLCDAKKVVKLLVSELAPVGISDLLLAHHSAPRMETTLLSSVGTSGTTAAAARSSRPSTIHRP